MIKDGSFVYDVMNKNEESKNTFFKFILDKKRKFITQP
jgi:hypothetical protein